MQTNVTGHLKDAGPQSGFSIVELMVTLVVLGLLAALATPSLTSIINNNRLAGLSNELTATLQSARMEATRRGVRVVVCPSDDGATCTNGERWKGWVAFADENGNGTPQSAEILRSQVLLPPLELWASENLSASGSQIVFRHDGFAYNKNRTDLIAANMRACIPTAYPPENARDVSLMTGARVSVARKDEDGGCDAPANP